MLGRENDRSVVAIDMNISPSYNDDGGGECNDSIAEGQGLDSMRDQRNERRNVPQSCRQASGQPENWGFNGLVTKTAQSHKWENCRLLQQLALFIDGLTKLQQASMTDRSVPRKLIQRHPQPS